MENKKRTTDVLRWAARIFAIAACAAFTVWIFSNSLKSAEESSAQSGAVFGLFKKVWTALFPSSSLAGATQDELNAVHDGMRNLAHFGEFCILGGLAALSVFSLTPKPIWQTVAFAYGVVVAVLDETLQIFSNGRAFEWLDLLLDLGGVTVGVGVSAFVLWLFYRAHQKRKKEKENE
ncbi:MAG: VanZ family protein [Clostridia bacterium]|nr:VanZ family protein [Clostridia bacterium]